MKEKATLTDSPRHDALPALPLTVYLLFCWSRPDKPLSAVYGMTTPKAGDWFALPDAYGQPWAFGMEPSRDPLDPTVWYVQVVRADPEPDASFYSAMDLGR